MMSDATLPVLGTHIRISRSTLTAMVQRPQRQKRKGAPGTERVITQKVHGGYRHDHDVKQYHSEVVEPG
jgi:hypothetical protein